ncbi:MAG: AAA family ATPase, partial [Alphaproteobacteria bacterium]|nr:AAA family ATPase [Alphaproteobacteria bacterium]
AQGFVVRGAALSGIAAENLEGGSGIQSRTIASLEYAWKHGRDALSARDVLVIDEAGLVGSRQMDRLLKQAETSGAKVVMIGDPEQLQAIEAGAAFRALAASHDAVEITEVRRQRADWQRQATRELATGRTEEAISRYAAAGMIHDHSSHSDAQVAVAAEWSKFRKDRPESSQIMLAYTRRDVGDLNALARDHLRAAGKLGEDHQIDTARGIRSFAEGDRIMFLKNDRSMGVKNGSLGEIEAIGQAGVTVRLDRGGSVSFDPKTYPGFDHGYAATIHKSQGVTVDTAHVLASSYMDRQAANVALTRHRDRVSMHYGRDAFPSRAAFVASTGRDGSKDITLDYLTQFAERHGDISDRAFEERLQRLTGLSRSEVGQNRDQDQDRGR